MNPKDIVYKMVVLGRRLTTHFILDIFWGSSFMFHGSIYHGVSRAGKVDLERPGRGSWFHKY